MSDVDALLAERGKNGLWLQSFALSQLDPILQRRPRRKLKLVVNNDAGLTKSGRKIGRPF
jgi:hypothetical protein